MSAPNILFLLIDDLGWRDLGCYGSSFYETPNIDRFAASGMRFLNAYASCPVCSPTRASIMSGKYPAHVGVTQWIGGTSEGKLQDVPYLHYLPLEETSLATALHEEGYKTWHVGKWHLGDEDFYPEKHGFDINIAGCHNGSPSNGYFSPWKLDRLEDAEEGTYLTDHLTDKAIDLIESHDGSAPFFLHLSHYAVHTPIQAPADLVEKYTRKAARLGLDKIAPIVEGEYFPCIHKSDQRVQRRVIQSDPTYAAMMENLDTNIGRVLQALTDKGLDENTIVIFTADNGGLATAEGSPTCNHPLSEGKGWSEEGGTRVCQMIRFPGVTQAGSVCTTPVTSTDFYPTLLEACDAPLRPAQHADGASLMPLLRNDGTWERKAIFWHYPHYSNQGGTPAASVVSGPWKLIEYFEDNRLALYNLDEDISEGRDLSAEHPKTVMRLHGMLKNWQRRVEAQIPEPNPDWEAKCKRPKIPNNAHE